MYYFTYYWSSSIIFTDLAVFSSSRGFVCLMAGERGFQCGISNGSGNDAIQQYFNETSFHVVGLLCIMPYVRDQRQNLFTRYLFRALLVASRTSTAP